MTSIIGGQRLAKDDPRVECLGELDEANSYLGLLRSKLEADHQWETGLQRIQTEMMNLMSHVATPSGHEPKPRVPLPEGSAEWMELDGFYRRNPSIRDRVFPASGRERNFGFVPYLPNSGSPSRKATGNFEPYRSG